MEANIKNIFIKSKIHVPHAHSTNKRLKLIRICIIAFIILIGLDMLMNGFDAKELRRLIIPIAVYIGLLTRNDTKAGYIFTPVEVQLTDKEITMNYPKVDKRDGMGNRREKITIPYDTIRILEYSRQQQCLNIVGRPSIYVNFENEKKYKGTKVEADGSIEKSHLLYLDTDEANGLLEDLKAYTKLEIAMNN